MSSRTINFYERSFVQMQRRERPQKIYDRYFLLTGESWRERVRTIVYNLRFERWHWKVCFNFIGSRDWAQLQIFAFKNYTCKAHNWTNYLDISHFRGSIEPVRTFKFKKYPMGHGTNV